MRDILPLFNAIVASEEWWWRVIRAEGVAPEDELESLRTAGDLRHHLMIQKSSFACSAARDLVETARQRHGLDWQETAALLELALARYESAWGLWSEGGGPSRWAAAVDEIALRDEVPTGAAAPAASRRL